MNESEVLNWIWRHLLLIITCLSIFIQISPIKWNPITSLFNWLGKTITKDVTAKVEEMNKTVDNIQAQVYANEKDRIRWEILDFANSCRNGKLHTKDEFDHVIALNTKYKQLLIDTKDSNGVFDAEYEYIEKIYKKRQDKNDFL